MDKHQIRVIVAGQTGRGKSTIIQILTDALEAHGITTGFKLEFPDEILHTGDPYCPAEMQAKRIASLKAAGTEVLIEERYMYKSMDGKPTKIRGVQDFEPVGPTVKVVE